MYFWCCCVIRRLFGKRSNYWQSKSRIGFYFGSVKIGNDYAYDIKDLGSDKYSMDVFSGTDFTITLTFSSKNSGTISDSLLGEGTITKRN